MQGLSGVPVPEGVWLGKVLVRHPQILELQGYNHCFIPFGVFHPTNSKVKPQFS